MRPRSLAASACVLLGALGSGACVNHADSTPTTPTAPATPGIEVCAYAPPPTVMLDAVGGFAAVAVQTAAPCRWTAAPASSADSWITIPAGASVGPGTLGLTLQPNRSFAGRSGAVVIKNERGEVLATQTVGQRAAGCLYSVSPTAVTLRSSGTYDGAGDGPVLLRVHAEPADCQWTATPSVPWITIVYNSASGSGDREVYVSVLQSNLDSSPRIGDVVIAGLSGVNPDAHAAITQAGR